MVLRSRSRLDHQEVDVIRVLGLEGLGDDAGGVLVLAASQGNAVDLQDDLTHLQLVTAMSRASFLSTREGNVSYLQNVCVC